MNVSFVAWPLVAALAWLPPHADAQHGDHYGGELGTVDFPVSCNSSARAHATRGLALLHHMTYEGARASFEQAAAADPDCAMAYWGQAMSHIHPLWSDPPDQQTFAEARELADKAATTGERSEREDAWIAAVKAYYDTGWSRQERPALEAFDAGWRDVHERFPDDPEGAALHALAHLALADPKDKTYRRQEQAAAIARAVLDDVPRHPGAHHYIIHAYDYPPLAHKALDVARSYAAIAPAVPHALHMPSHIFVRLGLWDETIDMNERSAAAALKHPAGDEVSMHYPHALDYLAYAHLQRGEDDRADEVLARLRALEQPVQPQLAAGYSLAAIPARLALERHDWDRAAMVQARTPENFPWERFPSMEALSHYARAIGAARSGRPDLARAAIDRLETLQHEAAETSDYWATQVEVQKLTAQAWLAHAEERHERALETMQRAAALERSTEKHPVTPGELLPAQELLGDMLLEHGQHDAATAAYQAALQRSPQRFNSVYGLARASELAGDDEAAGRHYAALVELAGPGAERRRLQRARDHLAASGQ